MGGARGRTARQPLAALAAAASALAAALAPAAAVAARARCVPVHLNRSAVLAPSGLAVSPLPGSYDASPYTQISLLGAPAGAISGVRVAGTRSGTHPGRLRAYSQGDGASFVPARPFTPGEAVSVSATVAVAGAATPLAFRFVVAEQSRVPYVITPHITHDPSEEQHFHSRPDLQPPVLVVTARSPQAAPGLLLAAPYSGPGPSGPAMFDEAGGLVWFHPLAAGTESANLQVQSLEGRPVLTWWQGYIPPQGFGQGEEVVADSAYRTVLRVRAGNGYRADLHDFHITPQTTALLTAFDPIHCDLSAHGGPRSGFVTDTLMQELDLRTGLVRREWHALDHVALGDSYSAAASSSEEWPFDYFHLNSIDENGATTLISARNTSALYVLDTQTGQVRQRIGGRHSDVTLGPGAATAYQHDATEQADGTITIFDNGASPRVHAQSRGLVVSVDAASRTASVVSQYLHPAPLSSGSQGNVQLLSNGDVFLGWGSQPYFSEFSASGALLFDAHMHGSYESYRAYREQWSGAPGEAPAIALARPPAGAGPMTVFASWNGDTRTVAWRVLAGASAGAMAALASAPRAGFETAVTVPAARYVAVQALNAGGAVIGTSRTLAG